MKECWNARRNDDRELSFKPNCESKGRQFHGRFNKTQIGLYQLVAIFYSTFRLLVTGQRKYRLHLQLLQRRSERGDRKLKSPVGFNGIRRPMQWKMTVQQQLHEIVGRKSWLDGIKMNTIAELVHDGEDGIHGAALETHTILWLVNFTQTRSRRLPFTGMNA